MKEHSKLSLLLLLLLCMLLLLLLLLPHADAAAGAAAAADGVMVGFSGNSKTNMKRNIPKAKVPQLHW